ncbi:MAG: carbohydrate kinase family protein [Anaerolineae bacterium]|nr:carbohydrate kinase family protein [Anaerolineae bacterium]
MDLYVDQGLEYVGGNALNVATQCRRSGVERVAVVGAVGVDAYAEPILAHLRAEAIDVSHVYRLDGATATHKLYLTDGDRQDPPDAWQGGVFDVFRLSDADWAFVNTFDVVAIGAGDPNFATAVARLSPHAKLVADFLDTRDFDRLERHIDRITVAVLSARREDVERARMLSAEHPVLILVTLGAEGSVALWQGEAYFQPAIPVADVVDTTGCGDTLQGAFIVSWFEDFDIGKALHAGAEAAAHTLTHFGGV